MQNQFYVDYVYDVMDEIEMPSGEEIVFLKYKDGRYVRTLGSAQQLLVSHLVSHQVFPGGKQRYSVIPTRVACELWFSKTDRGKEFKKIINDHDDVFHRELLISSNDGCLTMRVAPDAEVIEKGSDMFLYDRNIMKIPYHRTPIKVLQEAKLLDKLEQNVITRGIEGGMYEFDIVAPYSTWCMHDYTPKCGFAIETTEHDYGSSKDYVSMARKLIALQLQKGRPEIDEINQNNIISYY